MAARPTVSQTAGASVRPTVSSEHAGRLRVGQCERWHAAADSARELEHTQRDIAAFQRTIGLVIS